MFKDHIIIILA